ncbi:MAG: carbohydrate ABC transporter permease [Chloroflexota bacterium]
MERVRGNWSAMLVGAFLIGGAAYIHTIDASLGTFLGVVAAIVVGGVILHPIAGEATRPLWSRLRRRRREALTGYLFAAPWIIGFLVFTLGPMLWSLYTSFCKYDIINTPVWKGWNYNYGFILHDDPDFRVALQNTLYYVIVKTPAVVIAALVLAILMNQRVPGIRVFRTIYYLPTVITGVAAIFLWVWVLNPNGILNHALGFFHIYQPLWFFDPKWTKPGLILMGMWYLGSPMLIVLAGLNGISRTLYEAAEVEGAGLLRKFWHITLPMLSPTLFFIILTSIIGAFQVFNSAFVISTSSGVGSGPGDPHQSLLFYEVYLYTKFKVLEMGYASALAWIIFVIIMVITAIQLYLSKRWVYYES